ncbi:MAG: hypothetical protein KAS01_00300 [Candidatus Pacebacteria bacterium]|nr:hypothetical protein [Candidatus Paceibacterota bacterium]
MNKKNIKDFDNQKGQVALLITLTTMFLLLFVGLFLTSELLKQIKTTLNKLHSSQAYYLADTGAEYISYKLIRVGDLDISSYSDNDEILSENIFNGNYKIIYIESGSVRVNSIGEYKKTSRNIRLEW